MLSCSVVSVAQSCPTLHDPVDCSLPGSSVHGILQGRILQWVATSSSRGSFQPRNRTLLLRCSSDYCSLCVCVSVVCILLCMYARSCPTFCDPMGCSQPGSSVHGISQARIWSGLLFPSPKDLPILGTKLMSLTWQADSLPLSHQGNS